MAFYQRHQTLLKMQIVTEMSWSNFCTKLNFGNHETIKISTTSQLQIFSGLQNHTEKTTLRSSEFGIYQEMLPVSARMSLECQVVEVERPVADNPNSTAQHIGEIVRRYEGKSVHEERQLIRAQEKFRAIELQRYIHEKWWKALMNAVEVHEGHLFLSVQM
ncbi:hypothetical protein [Oryza sativa Japonica Group]|uniref:Uncharacterized protein n=1 Tax=Oryza sativa subsp. japonica TaxID=39947 RepID=Q5N960_ORYSJ|nr:hypothetical protein [Oryza sativa Japonica Group]